ncbi:hypothetical protein TSOC_012307, partial [Tetrabaena socialis]
AIASDVAGSDVGLDLAKKGGKARPDSGDESPSTYASSVVTLSGQRLIWTIAPQPNCTAVSSFNRTSGALLWKRVDSEAAWAEQPGQHHAYSTARSGHRLAAWSLSNGKQKWTFPRTPSIWLPWRWHTDNLGLPATAGFSGPRETPPGPGASDDADLSSSAPAVAPTAAPAAAAAPLSAAAAAALFLRARGSATRTLLRVPARRHLASSSSSSAAAAAAIHAPPPAPPPAPEPALVLVASRNPSNYLFAVDESSGELTWALELPPDTDIASVTLPYDADPSVALLSASSANYEQGGVSGSWDTLDADGGTVLVRSSGRPPEDSRLYGIGLARGDLRLNVSLPSSYGPAGGGDGEAPYFPYDIRDGVAYMDACSGSHCCLLAVDLAAAAAAAAEEAGVEQGAEAKARGQVVAAGAGQRRLLAALAAAAAEAAAAGGVPSGGGGGGGGRSFTYCFDPEAVCRASHARSLGMDVIYVLLAVQMVVVAAGFGSVVAWRLCWRRRYAPYTRLNALPVVEEAVRHDVAILSWFIDFLLLLMMMMSLVAVDLRNGSLRWATGPLPAGAPSLALATPATLVARGLADADLTTSLYGIHAATGAVVWTKACSEGCAVLQVDGSTAIIVSYRFTASELEGVDLPSGKVIWRGVDSSTDLDGSCSGAVVAHRHLYFGCPCGTEELAGAGEAVEQAEEQREAGSAAAAAAAAAAAGRPGAGGGGAALEGGDGVGTAAAGSTAASAPGVAGPAHRRRRRVLRSDASPARLCGYAVSVDTGEAAWRSRLGSDNSSFPGGAGSGGLLPLVSAEAVVFASQAAVHALERLGGKR